MCMCSYFCSLIKLKMFKRPRLHSAKCQTPTSLVEVWERGYPAKDTVCHTLSWQMLLETLLSFLNSSLLASWAFILFCRSGNIIQGCKECINLSGWSSAFKKVPFCQPSSASVKWLFFLVVVVDVLLLLFNLFYCCFFSIYRTATDLIRGLDRNSTNHSVQF